MAPDPKSAMPGAILLMLFALGWMAIVLPWEGIALSAFLTAFFSGEPAKGSSILAVVFPLFGLPFVAVGIYLLRQPFSILKRVRTSVYAITSERVLLASAAETVTIQPERILSWRRSSGWFTGESLILSLGFTRDSDGGKVEDTQRLDGIRNAAAAEEAMRKLAAKRSNA